MKNLRLSIVGLLLWLTVFFNIERLDVAGNDTINLVSGVYFLAVPAMVLPLFSFFHRRSVLVVLVPVWLMLLGVLTFDPAPDLTHLYLYLTLVELMMLTVLTLLAHRVGQALGEFRHAVELVTFRDDSVRLRTLPDSQPVVQTEMSSSRRKGRPLSLLIFQADASSLNTMMHRFVHELQRSMMQRYVLAMTARVLSRHMRCTDLIIEEGKPGRLVLVAPDTSEEQSGLLGYRLTNLVQEQLGITAYYGTASFPDQALTFDELVSLAEQRLPAHHTIGNDAQEYDHEDLRLPDIPTRSST